MSEIVKCLGILACGIVLGATAVEFVPSLDRGVSSLPVPDTYDGCGDCSLIARQMAWSLDHQPRKWHTDGYWLSRPGASAWISNGSDGIEIGPGEWQAGALSSADDRSLIYGAYQRWITNEQRFR